MPWSTWAQPPTGFTYCFFFVTVFWVHFLSYQVKIFSYQVKWLIELSFSIPHILKRYQIQLLTTGGLDEKKRKKKSPVFFLCYFYLKKNKKKQSPLLFYSSNPDWLIITPAAAPSCAWVGCWWPSAPTMPADRRHIRVPNELPQSMRAILQSPSFWQLGDWRPLARRGCRFGREKDANFVFRKFFL